jgi:tripartite-type tricarboxylate transporter receptor subunit TctC
VRPEKRVRTLLSKVRGAGPAMQDLVAAHIDLTIASPPDVLPQLKAGFIKAYAVTANRRLPVAPEIPTVDEAGLPGFYTLHWYALWVPKTTQRDIIDKLNTAVVDALARPAVYSRLANLGTEVFPRARQTPEALGML